MGLQQVCAPQLWLLWAGENFELEHNSLAMLTQSKPLFAKGFYDLLYNIYVSKETNIDSPY